jgi:N-acetylglutamate synthase-like GNAT family acetyltransferase
LGTQIKSYSFPSHSQDELKAAYTILGAFGLGENDLSLIGVAAGDPGDVHREAYLALLPIASDMRGRGAGAALLSEFERNARLCGAGAMWLCTDSGIPCVDPFYIKNGY